MRKFKRILIDELQEERVRVWYRLCSDGCMDLQPSTCAQERIGDYPDWWKEDDADVEEVVSLNYASYPVSMGHCARARPWLSWALRTGVAPNQPFRLSIDRPTVIRIDEDYDCSWEYNIEQVLPCPAAILVKRWTSFFRKFDARVALAAANYALARQAAYKRTDAMRIHVTRYHTRSHEYGPPDGVSLRLITLADSPYTFMDNCLASAQEDSGDMEAAKEKLAVEACAKCPALSPLIFNSLPVVF